MHFPENHRSRAVLGIATAALALLGLLFIGAVLVWSMRPSARATGNFPEIQLPLLAPGSFAFLPDPMALDNRPSMLMVIRTKNGRLWVWRIPKSDGMAMLPDVHWWQDGPTCKRLEANFETEKITCLDESFGAWGREPYVWNLEGKNLSSGRKIDDMIRVDGREDSNKYILGPSD